ncbi:MAG: ABC transporter permease [Planctomycetota bacterium]
MGLPFDYAARNLGRRRLRTVLTACSAALVAALLVGTTAFVRGMSGTFAGAARDDVAMLLSSAAEGDIVRSAVRADLAQLVQADVAGVLVASGEVHMVTNVRIEGDEGVRPGFVRGVTERAYAVHDALTLIEGRLPGPGEVIVGVLAAAQMGTSPSDLDVGRTVGFEGAEFEVVGRFVAPGTTLEGELWTPLSPLRGIAQRDDDSTVFVKLQSPESFSALDYYAKRRVDLEVVALSSVEYYRQLSAYFRKIRAMAWILAALIAAAALFGGANTMAAAVQDRVRELGTLRALGYGGGAVARSLAVESLLLCASGGVLGLVVARLTLSGGAASLAMSAFALDVDAVAIVVGFTGSLALGVLGVIPAAWRALRLPVGVALKED